MGKFRFTNVSGSQVDLGFYLSYNAESKNVAGASLVDSANQQRHLVLGAVNGKCACSDFGSLGDFALEPKESRTAYAYFSPPPKDVRRATVLLPLTNPFVGVPLGAQEQPAALPKGQPERRPTKEMARHDLGIVSTWDSLDDSRSLEQDPEKTKIRLSADVLFALNKSTLRPKARDLLTDVAKRIDTSEATVIQVDGYTDSSGTPSINNPLSRERAKSVEKVLRKLVTRTGVEYRVEGHGADNPVASNETKEGRQENRRVTVTIKR